MEMVGHDFFLFTDAAVGMPSVVYRRRGYQYGVIRLVQEHAVPPSGGPSSNGQVVGYERAPANATPSDDSSAPPSGQAPSRRKARRATRAAHR
jgi:hypothetical protein